MAVVTDLDFLLLGGGVEAFKDDRDEQVEEDQTDHQDEHKEVEVGK